MRKISFVLTLLAGLVLIVLGFFLSAPLGPTTSPVISDPRMPFAPAIFTLGVMLIYISAIVYEVYPDKNENKTQ